MILYHITMKLDPRLWRDEGVSGDVIITASRYTELTKQGKLLSIHLKTLRNGQAALILTSFHRILILQSCETLHLAEGFTPPSEYYFQHA